MQSGPSPLPTVPANDFALSWQLYGEEILAAVDRVGRSGWLILGREVEQFEAALAEVFCLRHAVGVGNGMDALEIALRAAGLAPGEKVLTTPLSAFASTLAIIRAGGVPVFADVDASGLLDLEQAEALLATPGADIRWMLPVHLYGHCLDLERLDALRDRFGLAIIEDCAQSIGATWGAAGERSCGTAGIAAATSFYPTKNLGALGDGGAILTNSETLRDSARQLRHYGQAETYRHVSCGANSRLDELHAAILRSVFLPRLAEFTARRREIARSYRGAIRHPGLELVEQPRGSHSVHHLFPVLAAGGRRAEFLAHLRARGIAAGVHYPHIIPDQPALRGRTVELPVALPQARLFADAEVSLPIHPLMTEEQVEIVIDACNSWVP